MIFEVLRTQFQKLYFWLIPLIFAGSTNIFAQNMLQDNSYQYFVDLKNVQNDKISVELLTPIMGGYRATFHFAKAVPSSYEIYNFGRFISDFQAFDKNGNELKIEKKDANSWEISEAFKLYKVKYKIDDTFDSEIKENQVFDAAGNNFKKDSVFVINPHGFFGYFDYKENSKFKIQFDKPSKLYASTSLIPVSKKTNSVIFETKNYTEIADQPILFSKPDTATLIIDNTEIMVSIFSESDTSDVTSEYIINDIKTLLIAQKKYMQRILPVKKYSFLIYIFENTAKTNGALEHSYSSVYYIPQMKKEQIAQTLNRFASHEFFHILTPLSIHAEEIHNFDFDNPKMSEHLWLYEGVIEYFAGHVQYSSEMISLQEYFEILRHKLASAADYDATLPFTKLSKGIIDKYAEQYNNVYHKGALIGLCLDILLIRHSDGKYNLMNLIHDLSKVYDKDTPFKDNELFDTIEELTYPEIRLFLNSHVAGTVPLPLKQIVELIGIEYIPYKMVNSVSLGNISLSGNSNQRLFVTDITKMDDFGKKMDYKKGDIILKFNGEEIYTSNTPKIISKFRQTAKVGDTLTIQVLRGDTNNSNSEKTVTLSAVITQTESLARYIFQIKKEITAKQKKYFDAWSRDFIFPKTSSNKKGK